MMLMTGILQNQLLRSLVTISPYSFFPTTELIAYLSRSEEPSLILLDYNPVSGTDTLRHLKSHPDFNHIPVVVLSEVASPNHIRQCYQLGANSFIKKPHTANL